MTIHHSFDDLIGLGHRVVQAAKKAAAVHWGDGFTDGIPVDADALRRSPALDRTIASAAPDFAFLDNAFDDVPGLFASFAGPDPADCDRVLGAEAAIMQALNGTAEDVWASGASQGSTPARNALKSSPAIDDNLADVQAAMTGWLGQGASAFDDYILHFGNTVRRQHDAAAVLAVGMQAHRDIMRGAYQTIWQIGTETINVLDAGGTGGCDGTAAEITLFVVSGLAWVAAVPTAAASGGGSVGIATALTAFAAAVNDAPSFLPASKDKTMVQGTTILAVIDSMRSAIRTLSDDTAHQQRALTARLSTAAAAIDLEYKKNELSAAPPADTTSLTNAGTKAIGDSFYYA